MNMHFINTPVRESGFITARCMFGSCCCVMCEMVLNINSFFKKFQKNEPYSLKTAPVPYTKKMSLPLKDVLILKLSIKAISLSMHSLSVRIKKKLP